jgi:6-phosphogluconolactonase
MNIEFEELDMINYVNKTLVLIENSANNAIQNRNIFNIVVSGGESPRLILDALKNIKSNWEAWNIWFADERCLPIGHKDLNIIMLEHEFLQHVGIKTENIHRIKSHLGPSEAAKLYSKKLCQAPDFDLTLLGLGEDGHTASLFPGDLDSIAHLSPDAVPVYNSPKFPTERVTLSLSRINRSQNILFLVTGNKKRSIVNSFLRGENMPASLVLGKKKTSLFYCPEC